VDLADRLEKAKSQKDLIQSIAVEVGAQILTPFRIVCRRDGTVSRVDLHGYNSEEEFRVVLKFDPEEKMTEMYRTKWR